MQLPKEYQRFERLDVDFVTLMRQIGIEPQVIQILQRPNLQSTFERQEEMMAKIQRALGDYLERQRQAFPRFYFVGDEDLLEILGNAQDPRQIQRHCGKLFAGIASLQVETTAAQTRIQAMVSKEGEVVQFDDPIELEKHQRVHEWLQNVEKAMHETLASALGRAITGYTTSRDYCDWIDQSPCQILILATQIQYVQQIEQNAHVGGWHQIRDAIESQLELLAKSVVVQNTKHAPLNLTTRKKYEHLITELVFERDLVTHLIQSCDESNDHSRNDAAMTTWKSNLRHYFHSDNPNVLERVTVEMANASFYYGFEYLGLGERLVQTPLTTRCYLTLTQALHWRMGGNPLGPAGTGKTESVKALGVALGRFVLVFNCDERFDFTAMTRLFVGLCQVGAWGCFDEFNRLSEGALSAVSAQIRTIQVGLSENRPTIRLCGENTGEVTLHPDVGIFITMNPGYAGRSNLPDNLKQLFRAMAMVAPDRQLIAQVLLLSQGLRLASAVSEKLVLFFRLCEDQLSSQSHYDFGLRALKSVLVCAGNLKRVEVAVGSSSSSSVVLDKREQAAPNDLQLVIRSLCDTMIPKLVAMDVRVFETLLQSVFPGTLRESIHAPELRQSIVDQQLAGSSSSKSSCSIEESNNNDAWIEKVLQVYQTLSLRHGIMLVGPAGSGKTHAWTSLLRAMESTDEIPIESYVLDPKAMTKEELYGTLDPTTHEWRDGLFTEILRNILNNVRGESLKRHWIVFDGDVDPDWAENLNSVLDDNRVLTLPTGERLALPDHVKILIETTSVERATLASVSRCGMIWFSPELISTSARWCTTLRASALDHSETLLYTSWIELMMSFDSKLIHIVDRALTTFPHVMTLSIDGVFRSTAIIVMAGLEHVHGYNATHSDFPLTNAQMVDFGTRWMIYAMCWGFGGSMSLCDRLKFAQTVVFESFAPEFFPPGTVHSVEDSILNYRVDVATQRWKPWIEEISSLSHKSCLHHRIEPHQVLSTEVVIPTLDTVRHVAVIESWVRASRCFLLVGPPGCGKTMTLSSSLVDSDTELVVLNFSSETSIDLLFKTFDQYCTYTKVRGSSSLVLRPHTSRSSSTSGGAKLMIFCDEINLPKQDAYGTQSVLSFLRQILERGGFWKPRTNAWVTCERIQFVGACNPPTDVGRVALSPRFLRQVPILFVDFPAQSSLDQIYGTFLSGIVALLPFELRQPYVTEPLLLPHVLTTIYHWNQSTFDTQPHYVYSPRELSRWIRGIYEALVHLKEPDFSSRDFLQLVFHEGLRLFMDRLVTVEERVMCSDFMTVTFERAFPHDFDPKPVLPLYYSNWLSRQYQQVTREALWHHVEARLKVFYEEQLDIPLILFDDVLDHIVRWTCMNIL